MYYLFVTFMKSALFFYWGCNIYYFFVFKHIVTT